MDDILTIDEAAVLLKTSAKSVQRAVHRGQIPVIRLGETGKVWRFLREDLLRAARVVEPKPQRAINSWRRKPR